VQNALYRRFGPVLCEGLYSESHKSVIRLTTTILTCLTFDLCIETGRPGWLQSFLSRRNTPIGLNLNWRCAPTTTHSTRPFFPYPSKSRRNGRRKQNDPRRNESKGMIFLFCTNGFYFFFLLPFYTSPLLTFLSSSFVCFAFQESGIGRTWIHQ